MRRITIQAYSAADMGASSAIARSSMAPAAAIMGDRKIGCSRTITKAVIWTRVFAFPSRLGLKSRRDPVANSKVAIRRMPRSRLNTRTVTYLGISPMCVKIRNSVLRRSLSAIGSMY